MHRTISLVLSRSAPVLGPISDECDDASARTRFVSELGDLVVQLSPPFAVLLVHHSLEPSSSAVVDVVLDPDGLLRPLSDDPVTQHAILHSEYGSRGAVRLLTADASGGGVDGLANRISSLRALGPSFVCHIRRHVDHFSLQAVNWL